VRGPVFLSAGEQLAVNAASIPIPTRANLAVTTAWTQRQLVLESAPLNDVAEEFNRYSSRKLIVKDTAAEELRLSGVFATDPDFLLRYLRARPDITVVETGADIEITHHN
jgi:transmembrane sensor